MDISLTLLLAAFGGGAFGAAVGALPAFILTGFAVMAGAAAAVGGTTGLLDHAAFGPFLGPHTAFAGGVAAVAYANRVGAVESGRDITPALAGLNRWDVLAVGGVFGALGYLLERLGSAAGLASKTDVIALAVFVSAVVARLIFGRTGLFGRVEPGRSRFHPDDLAHWVRWQERPAQLTMIAIAVGAPSAYAAEMLGAPGGAVFGFGVAAAALVFIQFGTQVPVTHHIALTAAAGALSSGSVAVGVGVGIFAAFVGEFASRLLLIRGDTHIDPPAAAITLVIPLTHLLG